MSGNWTSETSCRGLINDNLCGIANRPTHSWFFFWFWFQVDRCCKLHLWMLLLPFF